MRVLVCIPCLLTGGTEIQTLSLVEALIAAGHEVMVACYFEHAETMVERYRSTEAEVCLMSHDGTRPNGIKNTVSFLWKGLKRIVHEFKPDVAHVQYMTPAALVVVILRALGMKKILATTHTNADIYSPNGLKVLRFLTRHVLVGMQCITERAEKSYFGTSSLFDGTLKKHFTIYNNIPSHIEVRSTPRPPKGEDEPIVVGVVSRLEFIKGMDLVVPAFAEAAKENPRLRLLVVGDGSLRESMEAHARESGVGDRIEFLGRKGQQELQECYDRIDILLMPSRSEGFGLTAIEGMARGCVPVVANVGGLPEVVVSGTGLVHDGHNVEDLALQICKASISTRNEALSSGALERAKIFAVANYRSHIEELYRQIQ